VYGLPDDDPFLSAVPRATMMAPQHHECVQHLIVLQLADPPMGSRLIAFCLWHRNPSVRAPTRRQESVIQEFIQRAAPTRQEICISRHLRLSSTKTSRYPPGRAA